MTDDGGEPAGLVLVDLVDAVLGREPEIPDALDDLAVDLGVTQDDLVSIEELADLAAALHGSVAASTGNVGEALDMTLERADSADLICVTGSLTTVGEARGHLRRLGRVS